MEFAFRSRGPLDETALDHSFRELVRRHEILRTRFEVQDGVPYQRIEPVVDFELETRDLSDVELELREMQILRMREREAQKRFDQGAGRLLRASLIKCGPEEQILLIAMHHLVADGWSVGVMMRELSTLYAWYRGAGARDAEDSGSPLPELEVQYADYASWQRRRIRGALLEEQLEYWKKQLSGAPAVLELPTDWPRPPVASFKGAALSLEIPAELTR